MDLTVSNDLAAAWLAVFPYPDTGCSPIWFDAQRGFLIIECDTTAWRTQIRLVAQQLAEKLNAALPEPIINKVVACLREVRVLVTGSRTWDDRKAIEDALLDAWHDVTQFISTTAGFTVVHGDCPSGADAIAKQWAVNNGLLHEAHAADWSAPCTDACPPTASHRKTSRKHGEYCPLAGHHRNQFMVDIGADLVLAFHRNNSRGTADCIARARRAGIPVRIFEEQHG